MEPGPGGIAADAELSASFPAARLPEGYSGRRGMPRSAHRSNAAPLPETLVNRMKLIEM